MIQSSTYHFSRDLIKDSLKQLIGKNITLYTESGGQSVRRFSGVLVSVHNDFVKLLCEKKYKHIIMPNPCNPIRRFFFRLKYGCSQRILKIETVKTIIAVKMDKITAIDTMAVNNHPAEYHTEKYPIEKGRIFPLLKSFFFILFSACKAVRSARIFFKNPEGIKSMKLFGYRHIPPAPWWYFKS